MKKLLFIFSLMVLTVITSGCIKCSYNISIDDKDNVYISETDAFNFSAIKSFDPNLDKTFDNDFEGAKKEIEAAGYNVEKYSDDTYKGITYSKNHNLKTFTKYDLPEAFTTNNEEPIIVKKGLIRDTYAIALTFNPKNVMKNSKFQKQNKNNYSNDTQQDKIVSKEKHIDPETGKTVETTIYESGAKSIISYTESEQTQFDQGMENMFSSIPGMKPVMNLTIKIPRKASKQNATNVISKTEYSWEFSSENPTEIIIEYNKYKFGTVMLIIFFVLLMFFMYQIYQKNINSSNW